jgi:hypothetical protein
MTFTGKCLTRRSNNSAVIIAIYCSMPTLFFPHSHANTGSHSKVALGAAICLVLAAGSVASYLCRKRQVA